MIHDLPHSLCSGRSEFVVYYQACSNFNCATLLWKRDSLDTELHIEAVHSYRYSRCPLICFENPLAQAFYAHMRVLVVSH